MDRTGQIEELTRRLVEFYERFSSWEQGVVKDAGITLPQVHALEVIGASGQLRMKELAERMGTTTGSLTVLVDRLVRAGLVAREPNENDRRSIMVRLTEEGEKHFREHHQHHTQLTRELATSLGPDEVDAFLRLIQKIVAHL
jgi:DNA-binding MarR family transcriptional regulator